MRWQNWKFRPSPPASVEIRIWSCALKLRTDSSFSSRPIRPLKIDTVALFPQDRGQEFLRLDELGEDHNLLLRMAVKDSIQRSQELSRLGVTNLPKPLDQVLQ